MLLRIIIFVIISLLMTACGEEPVSLSEGSKKQVKEDHHKKSKEKEEELLTLFSTPTEIVDISDWPKLIDDMDFANMELAIDRQLKRYRQKNLTNVFIQLGPNKVPAQKIVDSLVLFKKLILSYLDCLNKSPSSYVACKEMFNDSMKNHFHLYRPKLEANDFGYGDYNFARFTSYYTPLIKASKTKSGKFPYAIYKKPPANLEGYTRTEIDFEGKLENKNLELFYTKDLFELYLLHVQGGGKVTTIENNVQKEYYISYAGTNRKDWKFISIYMENQGYINNRSIEAQRKYLEKNPNKQKEIYAYCPSYVYFKISQTPPEGSDVVPLTDGRSIATDYNHYKFKGMLTFVQAQRPKSSNDKRMMKFSRFFLDQDTGGAIKGKARVDIYHGEGDYAELAAYNTDVRGKLFFLVAK